MEEKWKIQQISLENVQRTHEEANTPVTPVCFLPCGGRNEPEFVFAQVWNFNIEI